MKAVVIFYRGLLKRLLRARLGARLEERERIARDLHDTLFQSTQGLILLIQGFVGRLGPADPTRQEMEAALDQADHLLNEARDLVNDLRTAGIESDIVHAISRVGAGLFSSGPVGFKVVTAGTPRMLNLAVADDVCRIVREALTNALRHAAAANIEVEIVHETKQFRLRIRDDGRGIDPEILRTGSRPRHFGLQCMRERARRNGGTLNILSPRGEGTAIEVLIPAASAYLESPRKRRWISAFQVSRSRANYLS